MLGKNNEAGLYEFQRIMYLTKTAGFKQLVDKLRNKFSIRKGLSLKSKNALLKRTLWDDPMRISLDYFASRLRITRELFEELILGQEDPLVLARYSLPVYTVSYAGQNLPEGFYIKVSPYTNNKTISSAYNKILNEYNGLQSREQKDPSVKVFFKLRKFRSPSSSVSDKVYRLFAKIERYIFDDNSNLISPIRGNGDKIKEGLVADAIMYATDSDRNTDRFKAAKDKYYEILRFFEIPTHKEFDKLLLDPHV